MKILFSASTVGFYDYDRKEAYERAGNWPADLIEITHELHLQFCGAAPSGKKLGSVDGKPAWVDIPPPTMEELISTAENERQRLLASADAVMLDWRTELMLGEISDTNRAKLSEWLAYKNEVKSWDIKTDPENVIWPELPEA
ncbi:tail fiber assembly protein [Escherichia coli]|uniref:tail fiber assembly protein n=1 Tax=Escherichia coli TaxID=562 RepID=UPI00201007E1|nr:tail fiber assembly protein [Escherichia coli]